MDLKAQIRTVPDYPKPGILFYDIGSLLANGTAWRETVVQLAQIVEPLQADMLVGIESRGFIVAAALAAHMGMGFAMVRKKGKLPGAVISRSYALEYGEDTLEIQQGVLKSGARAVLCDDLLATGGTAAAAIELVRQAGAEIIHAAFVIELDFLEGRRKLDVPVTSLARYVE